MRREGDPVGQRTPQASAGRVVMPHDSAQVSTTSTEPAPAPADRCACPTCRLFGRTMARKEKALVLAGLAQADARTAERYLDGKPVARAVGDRLAMVRDILDNASR